MHPLELTEALISKPSITPNDAGCQDLLIEQLACFRVERFKVGDVDNFLAIHGETGPLLLFAGHTDVVPPGDGWLTPPFEPTIKEDTLFGRGAADMKSSLAAFTCAAQAFVAAHPNHPGRIGLLITSDEEGPGINGTRAVVDILKARGVTVDYCLIGEPTSGEQLGDTVKVGRRGSLNATLTIHGTQGHVAYPHLANNPIHQALAVLDVICQQIWDQGNAHFPTTTFQISNVTAGTGATNVIPSELTLLCNFRFSPESTDDTLKTRFEEILIEHNLRYTISWVTSSQPFYYPPSKLFNAVKKAIESHCDITPTASTTGGTSDGRFLTEISQDLVEFGPCNATIHKKNEGIAVGDINQLMVCYQTIITELFTIN